MFGAVLVAEAVSGRIDSILTPSLVNVDGEVDPIDACLRPVVWGLLCSAAAQW